MPLWLQTWLAGSSAEWTLFVSAFVSATLLPGGSEVILAGAVSVSPDDTARLMRLIAAATAGNTLGALTSWAIGRFVPNRAEDNKAAAMLRRRGAPLLLFSWLPVVGDALPLAAGWLRLPFVTCAVWIALGKLMRYLFVTAAALALF